jgi:DNA polymerase
MPDVFFDIESRSAVSLRLSNAWRYAGNPSTSIWFFCYAVDDGPVMTWRPPGPPPQPFIDAHNDPEHWRVIAHGIEFDRAMYERQLMAKYGFPAIPLMSQHCSMSLALYNSYPAELDLLAEALGLPYRKDPRATRAMRELARPRRPRRGEKRDQLYWVEDPEKLGLLHERCQLDVITARAVWRHSRLPHLSESERQLQVYDFLINRRGVHADRAFAEHAHRMTLEEHKRLNCAIAALTDNSITTTNQNQRILAEVNAHGHQLTSLTRKSVSAALAAAPSDYVRELLELRRSGAKASTHKFQRVLTCIDDDDRLRATMRIYGAGPGRWAGRNPQLHNLKRNDSGMPLAAVDAVLAEDRVQLQNFGEPLAVLGDIARAVVCAGSGNELKATDLGAIESRVLAWFADDTWKLDAYREYDRTGDVSIEPYRITAGRMLQKDSGDVTPLERQIGKAADLACGFGGSVGAWQRILPSDKRPEPEILVDVNKWRTAHPKITNFWRDLMMAVRVTVRTGLVQQVGRINACFKGGNLALKLPSGRCIIYPEARLVASKFEGYPPDVVFKDNAYGKWKETRGWHGTFVENVVQGTARDLLAEAIVRFEQHGVPVVLHVHDEIVGEVPVDSISDADFLASMLTAPAWADGLPLAGKCWSGLRYLEPVEPSAPEANPLDAALDAFVTETAANVDEDDDDDDGGGDDGAGGGGLADLDEATEELAPLPDLVTLPLTADNKCVCPFHEGDTTPSMQLYPDRFHCFACGAHGSAIDWLTNVEELSRDEAIAALQDGNQPCPIAIEDQAAKLERALALWHAAGPIAGTLAARYLDKTRSIDLTAMPAEIDNVLRFHGRCPFGSGTRHPCLLALLRNPTTDAITGIQRIALTPAGGKIDRRMLGGSGVVQLWPASAQLTIGEGIETVLAGATRIPYRDAPLQPAWAAGSADLLAKFPVLPGVERLIILVDHDTTGLNAADICTERWTRAGRRVEQLLPDQAGADFNDLVMDAVP